MYLDATCNLAALTKCNAKRITVMCSYISRLSEVYSFPMGQTEIRESSIGGPADGYVVGRNLLVQPCLQGGEVLEKSVGAHLVGSGKLF